MTRAHIAVSSIVLICVILLLWLSTGVDELRGKAKKLTTEQTQRQRQLIADQNLLVHYEDIVGKPAEEFRELLALANETALHERVVRYIFRNPARPNDDGSDGWFYIAVEGEKIVDAGHYDAFQD
ncbi:MAG: hypothetical protein AB8G99_25180 [Planctomycetaceae bacterium]